MIFRSFHFNFAKPLGGLFFAALFLCGCEAAKENHRTTLGSPSSPAPSATSSSDPNSASASPTNSASPSTNPSASVVSTASPNPSTAPSSSLTPSASPSPSSSTSPTSSDTQPPTPGSNGEIAASEITAASLVLDWSIGTDNKTAASQLQYLVYRSNADNLGSLADIDAHGTAIGSFIPDVDRKIISDLNSSTTYYFNVVIKDAAGNRAIYTPVSATTSDTTAPTPGNSGAITASNIAATSVTINWIGATDNHDAGIDLVYLVYRSTLNNLTTVTDCEINGTAVGSYTAQIATKAVTGLISSRTYYFNVIVKDNAGNKNVYTTQSVNTLDITPPVPANSGTITASSITDTSLSLTWTKGNDNLTAQAILQYQVYQSTANNVPSVSGAEANGSALGTYTTDLNTKAVSGLSPSTTYYFNIVFRDAADNKAAYTMLSVTTLPLPPTFENRPNAYAKVSTAWTYQIVAFNGTTPLIYSLTTAPAGATINSSTGLISYTPGASTGTQAFTVHVVDASSRSADQNFTLNINAKHYCTWTGNINTAFSLAGNWIFCNGAAPVWTTDSALIDGARTNQPTLDIDIHMSSFAPATTGAGGTLTIAAGKTLDLADSNFTVLSDVTIKGDSPGCTTCFINSGAPQSWPINILNGATLTIGSGITIQHVNGLSVGSGSEAGHVVFAPNSSNSSDWPKIDDPVFRGITVVGPVGNPSSISIDGLNFTIPHVNSLITIYDNSTVKKIKNINFSLTKTNVMDGSRYHQAYILFYTCSGVTVQDSTWSNLNFAEGVRNREQGGRSHAVSISACSGLSPITISGSGRAYGLGDDSNHILTWNNSSSSTCTWTGATSTNWSTPSNWSNCTNGRSNYPDQLDRVIIPVAPVNQPLVSGNYAMQGTAAGSGGGTITIAANSSLYISAEDTGDTLSSSVSFAGATAGCTTCLLQPRASILLGDGVTLALLPNIQVLMTPESTITVGESSGRANRAASFVVNGGATPANYPVIKIEPNLTNTFGWNGIVLDGSTTANSTVSIDGLVLINQPNYSTNNNSGLLLKDRFTLTKFDHVTMNTVANTNASVIQITSCANSSLVTTWQDLTITSDPSPNYAVDLSSASCSAIAPITITGQGAGYSSSSGNDPNGRLTW